MITTPPFIVGCGTMARVGKDSFVDMLKKELSVRGYSSLKYPLASPLKHELDDFLLKHFDISAFTDRDDEKDIIRDILVAVGKAHRKSSKGTYFTGKADNIRANSSADFFLVPDIRYAEPEYDGGDEVDWLKRNNGYFVYLHRILPDNSFVEPANEDERRNSERIATFFDPFCHHYTWPSFSDEAKINFARRMVRGAADDILNYFGLPKEKAAPTLP